MPSRYGVFSRDNAVYRSNTSSTAQPPGPIPINPHHHMGVITHGSIAVDIDREDPRELLDPPGYPLPPMLVAAAGEVIFAAQECPRAQRLTQWYEGVSSMATREERGQVMGGSWGSGYGDQAPRRSGG